MGIHGLTKYCTSKKHILSNPIVLEDTHVAIDFEALLFYCCSQVIEERQRTTRCSGWAILGGRILIKTLHCIC